MKSLIYFSTLLALGFLCLFTINMLNCTYSVSQAIPLLYVPGGGNGWEAPNLGAGETPEVLVYNSSANLPAPGVGTYTVTLDMRTMPYSYTFVQK